MTCGIVCGFAAEQKIAAAISPLTAIGWRRPDAARRLVENGATTLLSFGLAGALDPALRTGDLLLPVQLIMPNGSARDTSADFRALLEGLFPGASSGPLYAGDAAVASAEEKHALHLRHRAVAADMESGDMARIAEEAGIPFAVLRVVCDEARDTLPPAALCGLDDEGGIAIRDILSSLLRRPLQFPALIRTGRQSRRALSRLEGCVAGLKQIA